LRTLIIAEAGVNHNGDLATAKRLVDAAVQAGSDIIKFQTFRAENLVTEQAPKAKYQISNMSRGGSQYEMLKNLELSQKDFYEISRHCAELNVEFLSTAFDTESLEWLVDLGLKRFKIPSGEITNLPYLREIGKFGKETILSTGMSTMDDIDKALRVLEKSGTSVDKIIVLHCTTNYPAIMPEVNLLAMNSIRNEFGVRVGYSDHTLGSEVAVAAVALGACVIEKHFTLDKNSIGPDHAASSEPAELMSLISQIRNIEEALGDGNKHPFPSELEISLVARKSLVASREIQKGEFFSPENLTSKRPGTGVSPMAWDLYIGTKSSRHYDKDELIEP
jgi:N,N'-diacetyllegionaminate synthase